MRNEYYYDAVALEDELQKREMPRKVCALHDPTKDRQYSDHTRATRKQFSGQWGIINDMSNSHGLCFEVLFPEGSTWYEPEELD